jgi:hypothetical protein
MQQAAALKKRERRMADNFSGKTRHMTATQISDIQGSKIMRGLLIGLTISIFFWAALAYFLL